MEIPVFVSETLHKNSVLYPSQEDYIITRDQDDGGCRDFDVEYTSSFEEMYRNQSFTLEELLKVIPQFLETIKPNLDENMREKADVYISACEDWIQDELEVIED